MNSEKSVFISYRRSASRHLARAIFLELSQHNYDVFLDVNTIDSGKFDTIILRQIAARTHFVVLLSPGALDRCVNKGDWLRREIEEAMRLKRNIVPIIEEGFDFGRETAFLPEEWRDTFTRFNALPLNHFYFDAAMDMLRTRYLKMPEYHVELLPTAEYDMKEVQKIIQAATSEMEQVEVTSDPISILPPPFEWVDIPAGKVMLRKGGYLAEQTTFDVPDFQITKYPITNRQFAMFIGAGGYDNPNWWTKSGWQIKQDANWQEPRFWHDPKFNGANNPVVGISWLEAVAFCNWLNDKIEKAVAEGNVDVSMYKVALPAEQQWKRAATGDDDRKYPWGNAYDKNRSNTEETGVGKTTPVTRYEQVGDSPFGVSDMTGNVWEWSLTDWSNGSDELESNAQRVVNGGSWNLSYTFSRLGHRNSDHPFDYYPDHGFRIVRLVD